MPSLAQDVYMWIDNNDVRHFADTPSTSNSTVLTLPEIPQDRNQLAPTITNSQKFDNRSKTHPPLSINIISPTNGETIRDNNGAITVKITLNRALIPTEQLQLLMNGKPIGALSTKTVWQLKKIERGSHSFSIQLVVSGKVIASSSLVTVYLHRASVS